MTRPAAARDTRRNAPHAATGRARRLLPTMLPAGLLAATLILPGHMFQTDRSAPPIGLGPAAWPEAALSALALFSVLWIGRDLLALRDPSRGPTLSPPVEEERYRFGHALAGLALIVVYGWALPVVGFSVATVSFIAAWCLLGGIRRWWVVLPVALIGTFAVLWLFMGLALMPLPRGRGVFDGFSVWLLQTVGIY